MKRYLEKDIQADLEDKLVLLSGPRQVGKTIMAKQLTAGMVGGKDVYLNWDYPPHRKAIRNLDWPKDPPVVVLDEIHKYSQWKGLLKGFFDIEGHRQRLLVTGSAMLNIYKKGGDSLLGRAFHYRLHPLSIGEMGRNGGKPDHKLLLNPGGWGAFSKASFADIADQMLYLGGFPEPLLKGNRRSAKRWQINRRERVLQEDLRDLSLIRDIGKVDALVDLLLERVGAMLSVNSLREDLEVEHRTVASWIETLERLHFVFQIKPYSKKVQRGINKARKVYFWDWSEVNDKGARFENMVAVHLLKLCHYLKDTEGIKTELRYVRDRNKHEVDFLLLKEQVPWVLVEAKQGETKESKHLKFFAERLNVAHYYQVTMKPHRGRRVLPCWDFLASLP